MITKIFASVSFQVFAMLAELLSFSLISFINKNKQQIINDDSLFYGALFSKLILFIIIILVSFIIKRNSSIINFKDYLRIMITPIISLVTIIAVTFEIENMEINSGVTICFIVTGIMIINITVYYLLENIIEANEIKGKQARMEIQFAFQEQKYEQTSLSFKKISSIIHDTNKHLLYLRECIEQDRKTEALSYIDKAVDNVQGSYKRINSGHLVIDALVSHTLNAAQMNIINFKSDIRIDKEKINIERYDLSVTLGNLLDNAVEACKKISSLDDRYIHISIITSDTALVISVINSKDRQTGKNILKTDKSDKLAHGYGLGNVGAIADKYGGTFNILNKESSFEAAVILPLRD